MPLLSRRKKSFPPKLAPSPRTPTTQQCCCDGCSTAVGISMSVPRDDGRRSVTLPSESLCIEAAWAAAIAFLAYETAAAQCALPEKLNALGAECDALTVAYTRLVNRTRTGSK